MTPEQLKNLKKTLIKKKQTAVNEIHRLKQTTKEDVDQVGDLSRVTFHMADQGTDSMEREKGFLFLARQEKYLKKIYYALSIIEIKGSNYGICTVCKKKINYERMLAVPTATKCVHCKNGTP